MKNFLTVTTLLLLIVSGYLGAKLYKVTHAESAARSINCPNLPYDYSKADFEGIIGYETAKAMFANYISDSAKAKIWPKEITNLTSFIQKDDDTRSVWFSLDRLKNFIWHVEEQNCTNGCKDSLGLRIYFAKYPDLNVAGQAALPDLLTVPKTYSNHHTLFMVPTYKNENQENVDFLPADNACRETFDQGPTVTINGGGDVNITVHAPTPYIFLMGTLQDAQNHGGLIPPGSPAGTSFQ